MSRRVEILEHLLGDVRDPTWGDMSQYLVHFTQHEATLGRILGTGCLKASRSPYGFSAFRTAPQVAKRHLSVCFSEVPLDRLERLTRRHGNYGIAFTKDFLRKRGAARVWYLENHSTQAAKLSQHLRALVAKADFENPIWELTPFIDLVIPGRYEWDWEREWRVRGDVDFDLDDVAFVVTPEGVEEAPALEGLHMHPKLDLIVVASTRGLEEFVEDLIKRFMETYEDPVHNMPVDGGEYVFLVDEWDTAEAVDELFYDVQQTIREQLIDYLNGQSTVWVRTEDVASIYQ